MIRSFFSLSATRRFWRVAGALLLLSTLLVGGLLSPRESAAWREGTPTLLPGLPGGLVREPHVAVDDNSVVHVVWMQENGGKGDVYYTKGQATTDFDGQPVVNNWDSPIRISDEGSFSYDADGRNAPRIAVGNGGQIYVVFGATNGRYIVLSNFSNGADGAWNVDASFGMFGGDNANNFDIDIDMDDENRPHVAYSGGFATEGSRTLYRYRQADGNWTGAKQVTQSFYLARNVSIAAAGTGANANVQIVTEGLRSNNNEANVFLSGGTPDGSFTARNLNEELGLATNARPGSRFPDVVIDPRDGDVYVSFSRNVSGGGYTLQVARGRNNGASWSGDDDIDIRINSSLWPLENGLEVRTGEVTTISAHLSDSLDGTQAIYAQTTNFDTGDRGPWVLLSNEKNNSFPATGAGASLQAAVFNTKGLDLISYNLTALGPVVEPTPEGTLVLDGGAVTAADSTVDATFNDLSRPANTLQYRLSESQDGLNGAAYTDLPDNATAQIELEAPAGGEVSCVERTVYGQLKSRSGTAESVVLQDSIAFDPGVDAFVVAENPYANNNFSFVQSAVQNDAGSGGAFDGDARYTRDPIFFSRALVDSGECSGITRMQVRDVNDPDIESSYRDVDPDGDIVPLLGFSGDGTYTMEFVMTDGAGNQKRSQRSIILDTQSPVITNAPDVGIQTLDKDLQPVSRIEIDQDPNFSPDEDLLVEVELDSLQISDNLYGANGEELPLWGVWVANAAEPISANDDVALDALTWFPVELSSNTTSLQATEAEVSLMLLNWSLATGLNPLLFQDNTDTTVYTCVRVLDGAGNPSEETLCTSGVEVDNLVRVPGVHLPMVIK